MAKISDIEIPSLLFDEQASDPATPAAGFGRLYVKSDGVYFVDDAGVVTGPLSEAAPGGGFPTFSGVSLTKSATQSVNSTSSTAITFDGETFDTDAYHDNVTNPSRITVPATGYYMVGGSIEITGLNSGKYLILRLRKNGTTVLDGRSRQYSALNAGTIGIPYSKIVPLTAGDYVELMAEHDHGSALNVRESANGTTFWCYRVA